MVSLQVTAPSVGEVKLLMPSVERPDKFWKLGRLHPLRASTTRLCSLKFALHAQETAKACFFALSSDRGLFLTRPIHPVGPYGVWVFRRALVGRRLAAPAGRSHLPQ